MQTRSMTARRGSIGQADINATILQELREFKKIFKKEIRDELKESRAELKQDMQKIREDVQKDLDGLGRKIDNLTKEISGVKVEIEEVIERTENLEKKNRRVGEGSNKGATKLPFARGPL